MTEKKPRCRIKGCTLPVTPGSDLCFAHHVEASEGREEVLRQQRDQLEQDFRETFDSEAGLRVLAYLASAFYFGDTTLYLAESGGVITGVDPFKTVFNEGCRYVVLRILALAGRYNLKEMEEICRKKT